MIHSYRHRHGNAAGDPRYEAVEAQLAAQRRIKVPTIVLHGALDDVGPPQTAAGHEKFFTGGYDRRVLEQVGHNPPQESPQAFAQAVLELCPR